MREIIGKYCKDCKIFTDNVEDEALSLLYDEKEREEEKKQAEIEYAEEHGLNKGIKQTAKNMLERNMNIDVVAEITGLSLEEVIKLKEDI